MSSTGFGWQPLLQTDAPPACRLKAGLFTTYDRADEQLLVEHVLPLLLKPSHEPGGEGAERQYFLLELDKQLKRLHDRLVVVSSTVCEEPMDTVENDSGAYGWIWRSIRHLTVGSRGKAVQHSKLWLLHWEADGVEYLEVLVSSANLTRAAFKGQVQAAWRTCIDLRPKRSESRLRRWGILPEFLRELAQQAGDESRLRPFAELLARADCPEGVSFVASVPGTHSREVLQHNPWGAAGLREIMPSGYGAASVAILSPFVGSWHIDALSRWCARFDGSPDRLGLIWIDKSNRAGHPLVLESTRRQFLTARDILARLNGSNGEEARRGILLADDVGLGKTTVAALVAWVVASAGKKRGVRILAPNDVMMRRWSDELRSHIAPLQICAKDLDVRANRVKAGRVGRLSAGSIQIVKHSYAASDFNLACDLLIVDEAHRAKGENTAFSIALKRQKKYARRVLILTATPFSISLDELRRMLTLIGGEVAHSPVRSFSRTLDVLYTGNTARSPEVLAERLALKAKAVVEVLRPFVIRHGIDDLPGEQSSFGDREDWNIDVPEATAEELELMLRMDRALRVAKNDDFETSQATNDPRFHVGWRYFDAARENLKSKVRQFTEPAKAVVEHQLRSIKGLRDKVGIHSKMAAVAADVKTVVEKGEKVVLFCHHIATAQELTVQLDSVLPKATTSQSPGRSAWRQAWDEVLVPAGEEHHENILRYTFIAWLCADPIRAQTWAWLRAASASTSKGNLPDALKKARGRHHFGPETIAQAAQRLYYALLQSKSSRAVLWAAALQDRLALLPGANGTARVLGVCAPSENKESLFLHNQQPDTVISIFNSPFGPDVLVVTDKLSEGIDLHRYCRHLIHYELDPSPIRTVQRNGRLRRVNSWAAVTHQPILYAYPAFRGTRDHRLVQIMKKRIDSFSLLLGGVQDFDVEEVVGSEEKWRNDVIALAKSRLSKTCGLLCAQPMP